MMKDLRQRRRNNTTKKTLLRHSCLYTKEEKNEILQAGTIKMDRIGP